MFIQRIQCLRFQHNVISIWRNKLKENDPHKAKIAYDCIVTVSKCREDGEQEKSYGLFIHRESMQFINDNFSQPIKYYADDSPF